MDSSIAQRPAGWGELIRNWRPLLIGGVGMAFGSAGLLYYTQGLFFVPLMQSYGVSLGRITSMSLLALIPSFLCTVMYGRLIDRFGPRWPAVGGILLYGGFLALLGRYSGGFLGFQVLWTAMMACAVTAGPVAYARMVNSIFREGRGRALGLVLCTVGIVGFVAPTPVASVIADHSYRTGYEILAICSLIPIVPLVLLGGVIPGRAAVVVSPVAAPGWDVAEALRSRGYVLTVLSFMFAGFGIAAMQTNFSAMMQVRGLTAVGASHLVSVIGAGVITGRLGAGYLMDRVHIARIAPVMFLITAAALALLLPDTTSLAAVSAFFIGTGFGMEVDMIAFVVGTLYGLRRFGTLYAIAYMSVGVCLALGPFTAARIFDAHHSFTPSVIGAMVSLGIAAVLATRIPRSRVMLTRPERRHGGGAAGGLPIELAGESA